MKYKVQCQTLANCNTSLVQIAKRHNEAAETLSQVRAALAALSGMETIRDRLTQEIQRAQEQRTVLLKMSQAVQRAREVYRDTENSALDVADCPTAAVLVPSRQTQVVADLIGQYSSTARQLGVSITLKE